MPTIDDLASKLAEDTLAAMAETGDDRLYVEIASSLAASSQSLEEAFLTEIRLRLSERTARAVLERKRAAASPRSAPSGGQGAGPDI